MQPDVPSASPKSSHVPSTVLCVIGAVVLLTMMAFTFVDVLCRYLFNEPLPGGFEVTELMLAVLIFTGLPMVSRLDQHIVVDILDSAIPAWLVRPQRLIVSLVSALCLIVLAWRLWIKAAESAAYGATNVTLKVPMAPFVYYMSVLCGLSAIVVLVNALPARRRNHES